MGEKNPSDEQRTEEPALPFFEVGWQYGQQVRIRAGWVRGEEVELAMDAQVPIEEASDQLMTAYNWCVNRWSEIIEAATEAAEAEEESAQASVDD